MALFQHLRFIFINEKSRNLIVHHVQEPSAESGLEKKSHDISTVSSIFDKFLGVKVKPIELVEEGVAKLIKVFFNQLRA